MTAPLASEETWSVGQVRRLGHLELLLALVTLLVVQSFLTADSFAQRTVINVLMLLVVLSSIRSFSQSQRRLRAAMTLGMIAFLLSSVAERFVSTNLAAIVYATYIAIFLLMISALAEDVFQGDGVELNRILGAVCIFFVLGILWAFIYALLETMQPQSFRLNVMDEIQGVRQDLLGEFFYFSNVTLTTLGYGDIVPLSKPARTLATLEAMMGQLYIAIIIAHLVGLYVARRR